jgi:hypothetical protein
MLLVVGYARISSQPLPVSQGSLYLLTGQVREGQGREGPSIFDID